MKATELESLQAAFIAIDKGVKRAPLRAKIGRKPDASLQVAGKAFPVWTHDVGGNALPDGDVLSRYVGSHPDYVDDDAAEVAAWYILGPIARVLDWYRAWLDLLNGEARMRDEGIETSP